MKRWLWEPFRLGQMDLKNRIVLPPMLTRYGTEDGCVTERIKTYYAARARGGAGLLIIENAYVHPQGQFFLDQLGISDDKFIPGMRELVQTIHKNSAKIALQLNHGGRIANSGVTKMQTVAPSPLAPAGGEVPKELDVDEIAEIVTYFANAASRAKRAGFDGVEIHGAHAYLINQFLSRSSNRRSDAYGGSLQNRAKFLVEIVEAVRKAVGTKYAVWCRINGKEYGLEDGISLEEAQEIARMAQDAGVDAIHVSSYGPQSPWTQTTPRFVPAIIADLAEGVKKAVTVPVIAVGRITPEAGEIILAEGKADLVAIGRALIADPELPNKAASDRLDDILPCILCMSCLDDVRSPTVGRMRCRVNPALGREEEYELRPAKKRKKVFVIGGGPAGMQAARVAASRGHHVILWEKQDRLGGQLLVASVSPYKDRIAGLVHYLSKQMDNLGVQVKLGEEVTVEMVEEMTPDEVIVATGAKPLIPNMQGVNGGNVITAVQVLSCEREVGEKVIIIGGDKVGCETAEFLANKSKKVTILEMREDIGINMSSLEKNVIQRLKKIGVAMETKTKVYEITDNGVRAKQDGSTKFFEGETVVLAVGMKSDSDLAIKLKVKLPSTYLIGDCVEPGTIREAISQGYLVGMAI